jgi:hypothetical protein
MTIKPPTFSRAALGFLPSGDAARASSLFSEALPTVSGNAQASRTADASAERSVDRPADASADRPADRSADRLMRTVNRSPRKPRRGGAKSRRSVRLTISILAFAVSGSLLSACGTPTEPSAEPNATDSTEVVSPTPSTVILEAGKTKLTSAQALKFSRMLYLNTEATGGELSASFEYGPASTFYFNGKIDWVKATGDMILSTKLNGKETVNPERIWWSKGILYREIPGLEAAMAAQGQTGIRYVARPIQKDRSGLDLAITYLAALAIAQPMNPLLVRQDPSRYWFAGADVIDGVAVEGFGNGRSTYSVGPDGRLKRIDTTFKAMAGPVQVNFGPLGPQQIELPAAAATVDIAEIPVLYEQLTAPTTAPTSAARASLPSSSEVPATEA